MSSRLTVMLMSLLFAAPVVLSWLWLVIVPVKVAMLCPEKCQCNTAGGHFIYCYGKSRNPLPLIHLTNVRILSFFGNNITILEKDSFVSLTELESLDINACKLKTILLGAFNGLTSLTKLSIRHNKLSEIIPGTFENMNSLEYLNIGGNRIEHLDSDMFSGLVRLQHIDLSSNNLQYLHPETFLGLPNLQNLSLRFNSALQIPTDRNFINSPSLSSLDISDCPVRSVTAETFATVRNLRELLMVRNEISEIIPGAFENMNSLEYLSFEINRLEHLDSDVFSGLVNLKHIDLSYNNIQYIYPDTFLGLPNLQKLDLGKNPNLQIPTDRNFVNSPSLSHLDISQCNVTSVSVETFANISALELLDLSYNELWTVDINILRALPKLSTLSLHGNPLQCDCQLQEVWRWCKDRNIQTWESIWKSIFLPECDTPSDVKGKEWGVLEKGQCLEGNIQYNGDYNSTSYSDTDIDRKEFQEYDVEFYKQYQLPIYAVPFLFGTTSNVILLIIIIRNKDMRTVSNMYILNLAISDIIYLTVLFSEACANSISDTWLDGDFMCTFLPFCRRLSVGLSAYSVALFSYQRYRVTVTPLDVQISSPPTWRFTVATICVVWIVAGLFAVPSALSKYLCEGLIASRRITYYQLAVIFELIVSCVLPLCVVAFSYVMSARHLVEISRSISEGTQNPQQNTHRNTAKIVVGMTVVFLISYVPYHVLWIYILCTEEKLLSFKINYIPNNSNYKLRYTYLISTCFLLINSCLNPVALFCTSPQFRQHLKRYLTCFCKTNNHSFDLELQKRN